VDVSIRPGWFHHPAEDARVRTVEDLVGLYFSSVGRNGKLLLNVPPMREGVLHPTDVARLASFRSALNSVFGYPRGSFVVRAGSTSRELGKPTKIGIARLEGVTVNRVRLTIDESVGMPEGITVRLYA
jgi:alpha-L-fucosidase